MKLFDLLLFLALLNEFHALSWFFIGYHAAHILSLHDNFIVCNFAYYNFFALILNEFDTTETLENAIASPANAGFNNHPNTG